ncbi:MAG: sel1 repeat family protein [Alphaproteobacteria bacterium]|nr:sel1 repeat family protein [Alphaproteobacteria bacterium]
MRQDFAEALSWYRSGAEAGRAQAQHNLARLYATGKGTPQDDEEAVRWYRMAADHGHAGALNNLGCMYEDGRGVRQDFAEARRWYLEATEEGDVNAEFNLGLVYRDGLGSCRIVQQPWSGSRKRPNMAMGMPRRSYDGWRMMRMQRDEGNTDRNAGSGRP